MSQFKHDIRTVQPNLSNVADQHTRLYRISGDENELRESLNKTGDGELLHGVNLLPNFLGVPVLDPLRVVVDISANLPSGVRTAPLPAEEEDMLIPLIHCTSFVAVFCKSEPLIHVV